MQVRFWGVRGSVASSGSHVARIGGNTPCVEVESQGHRLILDAGTGLRSLGESLQSKSAPVRSTVLFSHLHWDHVQGFPFFGPAYAPTTDLVLYGPGPDGDRRLREVLARQMEPPNFPVPLSAMKAQMAFRSATPLQPIATGPFLITPFELPHPQGCVGYLIEAGGKRLAYCTDVELSAQRLEGGLGALLEGADVLVLDAQYTPDEYEGKVGPSKRGWGHSTMMDAAAVARSVGAGRLLLFHHDPSHSDDVVEEMAEAARQVFPPSEPARENKLVLLG